MELDNLLFILKKHSKKIAVAVLFTILILFLSIFRDYGITFDEDLHQMMGQNVLVWYLSDFNFNKAIDISSNWIYYPSLYYTLCMGIINISNILGGPFDFDIFHFFHTLVGFLGIVYVYKLGRLLGGRWCGMLSVIALLLTPRYFGAIFNNPKDTPFAAFYIISVYYVIKNYLILPKLSKSLLLYLGLAVGFALGVRQAGIIIFPLMGLAIGLWGINYGIKKKDLSSNLMNIIVGFIVSGLIAWALMLVAWPWAQLSPVFNPIKAILESSNITYSGHETLMNGILYKTVDTPRFYLPLWWANVLPSFYFLGSVLTLFGVMRLLRVVRKEKGTWTLLLASFLLPLLLILGLKSNMLNGIRHTLFLLPPLCVFLTASCFHIVQSLKSKLYKICLICCFGLSFLVTLIDSIQLHPYQNIYFNRVVAGGLKNAAPKFHTATYASVMKEASEWIVENIDKKNKPSTIVVTGITNYLWDYYLNQDWYMSKQKLRLQLLVNEKKLYTFEEIEPLLPPKHYEIVNFFHKGNYASEINQQDATYWVESTHWKKINSIKKHECMPRFNERIQNKTPVYSIERQGVAILTIYQ